MMKLSEYLGISNNLKKISIFRVLIGVIVVSNFRIIDKDDTLKYVDQDAIE